MSSSYMYSIERKFDLLLMAIIHRIDNNMSTDNWFEQGFKMIEKYPSLLEVSTPVYKVSTGNVPYDFLDICALYHTDFPSIADKFEGIHRSTRPMIDVLMNEDISRAKMLLRHGFEIVKDCGYCIYCKHDERFNRGELDLIDLLIEHKKYESIKFIKEVISEETLLKRDVEYRGKYMYDRLMNIF